MNLADIRAGLAAVIDDRVPGVRVHASWPDSPQWGAPVWVTVLPDEPYVTYSEGAGRPISHEIRFRLVCLPLPALGPVRIQAYLDQLLSSGPQEEQSLRDVLNADLSAGQTACSVSVLSASIRRYQIGDVDATGAEVQVKVTAR